MRTLLLTLTTCLFVLPAYAQYSGGSGTPQDPYQIATAADLMLLGETPADYDKHFILTTDIDLDPNLPGRKVFDKAVIAPDEDPRDLVTKGTPFTGVFNGDGHTISRLTIRGQDSLGLFGYASRAEIKHLGVMAVDIAGSGGNVGGLVGWNNGGLVARCYSTGKVSGNGDFGGLVGCNNGGLVARCYSTGAISGNGNAGGLVGRNSGSVIQCYSTGTVSGRSNVGGLVGSGNGSVIHSVWDMETSGVSGSAGGVGLTTAEMMDPNLLALNGFANDPNWVLDAGRGYPRLVSEGTPGGIIPEADVDWLEGSGTPEEPYRIDTVAQLIRLGRASGLCDRHFVLGADLNLDPNRANGQVFPQAVIPTFAGVLDGNDHILSHLTIRGGGRLGLLGQLSSGAEVKDLGVVDVNMDGSGEYVGGLVGCNLAGTVTHCYSTGAVSGRFYVGGLVGDNGGSVTQCQSNSAVSGDASVGGLVGGNWGDVTQCHSTGAVSGTGWNVGGLVGDNYDRITASYSTGAVSGTGRNVGGLVGDNYDRITASYSTGAVSGSFNVGGLVGFNTGLSGTLTHCYSTGVVTGDSHDGGLIGGNSGYVNSCFWDIQTSGQTKSSGGTGKTTAEMHTAKTFLAVGWDFVGETANGTADLWWINEGKDYPRLWWEAAKE